uniref:NADP-dependent oxidoreductase domain-containing protein 1-like n=1 Tax=Saccoglossus kowalevskii TaxID=10224 RepID=A0ABM0GJB1_SACKO|nr:PREDICTED: NADP-dependent oxidoreductase domain-containing protein 1-like [Saccoglossus kowalevskii]
MDANDNSVGDITHDLASLQFENALTEEEKKYLLLRKRTHAITVSFCAQAAYFVTILNECRQEIVELHNPKMIKSSKFLQDSQDKNPVQVGILGCGRLGTHLANTLLTYADVAPNELRISTRRPETLGDLQERGVQCFHNNALLASSVHVLFICVLPSQLSTVAAEIRTKISSHCTVYSFVSAVPITRLKQILRATHIIKPEIIWSLDNIDKPWNNSLSISTTLEDPISVDVTCPLSFNKSDAVISTKEKLAEMIIYSFVNMCTQLGLNRSQTLCIVNSVILGLPSGREHVTHFKIQHFTRKLSETDSQPFPKFDMTTVAANETPLTKVIMKNEEIRKLFIKKYKTIFDKFYYWKGIKQVKN